ncbi:hypothetical protein GTA09_31025, partial [Rhodococcus hoagii]|nr:hypothetical protein [Prescottella equi]
ATGAIVLFPVYWITWYLRDTKPFTRTPHPVCDSRRMGNQRHADTTPHGYRGSAAKALVIAAICLIGGLTFTGLPIFETSLWIAYAVMVMVEIALAVVLFFSRWTTNPQQSSSYYWHCFKPDRATSTSRCDTPQLIRSSRSTTSESWSCALWRYI